MIPVLHGVWAAAGGLVGDFEHIETQTVGAGGAASIAFTNIPGTYKHLQMRCLLRNANEVGTSLTTNSGTFVRRHALYGDGAAAASVGDTTNFPVINTTASMTASTFGAAIVDFLDYASTSKNSTVRSLTGRDLNGSGVVGLYSQLYTSSAAITSITLTPGSGNFVQHSTVALYGVK